MLKSALDLRFRPLRRALGGLMRRLCDKRLPDKPWPHWASAGSFPNLGYAAFDAAFARLPESIQQHRRYFEQDARGYGEKAFHVMWCSLFREFALESFLEIGVYRGQILSLVALLQKGRGMRQRVTGISPFTNAGDERSLYPHLDYEADVRSHFRHFGLDDPTLVKACSVERPAEATIAGTEWDCVYIDGSHDYEAVRHDWEMCSKAVKDGGLIVLDDAGLYTGFRALHDYYPFRGHEGPSRVAREADRTQFELIVQVGHNLVFRKLPAPPPR
ncbi:MAG: class I SAM-dependent methyltransferase [Candidatus Binatia bacterium]|jgi:hypothetical protein